MKDVFTAPPKEKEICVYGMPENIKAQLKNIADHLRLEPCSFLKTKLDEIRNSYPQFMRAPMQD
jgi:hypothetical protein